MPRLVNQICDFALLYAWSAELTIVSEDTIQQLLDDGVFVNTMRAEEEEAHDG